MNKLLKCAFWSNLCVGAAIQILDILLYACGLNCCSALTLNQNAHFKTASAKNHQFRLWQIKGVALFLAGVGLMVSGCSQESPVETTIVVTQPPAPAYAGTIVAVGDSLTAGLGVAEEQAYPAQLARRLQAEGYNYQVINAGVSGETSSGALSRIEWVISSLRPDIVILETGANDGLRGLDPDLLKTNLDRLASSLTTRNIQVILAGMLMLPNLGPDYTRSFSEIYPKIAQKHGVVFIPFFLDGVAGEPHLNQPDRLHPTADGYTRIVETVYPYVVRAIERHKAK
ncbi:arylesterase [Desulfosarcina sp.]|uniref:arylesterase n=1 Tax=Desulfosarcina sp. TaxID=2027861 RepID=UPI00299FB263|nr:arylesterase [Desulfosarcina sp.]MDX2454232.1 arylesterase [Desulfosarcina sp.]MDX2491899.1 arylesterase [Desulfosarcina sp.]